ncbi:MAG: hypothetical protein ACOY4H_01985 [Thermodesulfobacteriota bacterium]
MKSLTDREKMNQTEICFGLNRHCDEASLAAFVQLFASSELLNTLIPRMTEADITATVDFLTGLIKRHLSESEYHRLFLGEEHP